MNRTMRTAAIAAVLMGVSGLVLLTGSTSGAFNASVQNSKDTAASGYLGLAVPAITGCDSAPTGSIPAGGTTAACTGTSLPATAGATAVTTTVKNTGTTTGTGSYGATSCLPVDLDNTRTVADPMLIRGGVTSAQTDAPVSATASLGLTGAATAAYAADITSSTAGAASITGIWFKAASSSTGGPLLGIGSQPDNSAQTVDHVIWMDAAGHVNYSFTATPLLSASQTVTLTSTATYRDNTWRMVTATQSTGATATATLFVNGTQVGTQGFFLGSISAATGYFHVGALPINPKYSTTASNFFTGSVADAFADDDATRTAAQVATLAGSASPAAWTTNIAANGGMDDMWALGDPATNTYTGAYPAAGIANPCTMITAAINAGAGATLAALTSSTLAFTVPAPGLTAALAITAVRNGAYVSTAAGLHLLVPVVFTETAGAWTTTLTYSAVTQRVVV